MFAVAAPGRSIMLTSTAQIGIFWGIDFLQIKIGKSHHDNTI
jgi:hypothetical protein